MAIITSSALAELMLGTINELRASGISTDALEDAAKALPTDSPLGKKLSDVALADAAYHAALEKTFVSIAAGITIDFVRENLELSCPVVRVMPNTPLLLSKGASALCPTDNVTEETLEVVEILTEDKMDAVISVNGSSPAYFYLFAKAMADYAEKAGISREVAMNLICATMEGSAEMLRSSGDDPETLIKKVSSKGGTTIEALNVFYNNNLESIVCDAMSACTRRASELSKEA